MSRALELLGLTRKEASAYISLLRGGACTAEQVGNRISVQYPAVYRVLHALESKGWIEVSLERPKRYRARPPRIVAEEAKEGRVDELATAAEVVGGLRETSPGPRRSEPDLWIVKGTEATGRKLREVVLASRGGILCASPLPIAPEVLRLVIDALRRGRRPARIVLNEGNRRDVAELGALLAPHLRVQFRFPDRLLPKTRLAHTFVFPNDEEVFILNSFYRDGELVVEKLQGLWVGDMDFVRLQLEATLEDLEEASPRLRRATTNE